MTASARIVRAGIEADMDMAVFEEALAREEEERAEILRRFP